MTKNLQIIFLLCFLVMAGFSLGQEVQAAACANVPLKGTTTISASCTFSGTVNGVEQGNLVIEEAATLTINGGRTVVWNPGFAVYIQGKLFIDKSDSGGQLRKALIWYIDADNDNYPDSLTMYAANTAEAAELLAGAPAGSAKRRSNQEFVDNYGNNLDLMAYGWIDQDSDNYPARANASPGLVLNINWTGYRASVTYPTSQDCNDDNAYIHTNRTIATDADQDGWSVAAASSQCAGDSTTVSGRTYYKNSAGNFHFIASASILGYPDCNDGDAARWRNRYRDEDGDTHCPNNTLHCVGDHSGYRDSCTTFNDCCDTDNRVHPGSGWYTSAYSCDGGPSSWDYNCDGVISRNPTSFGDCCEVSNWLSADFFCENTCTTESSGCFIEYANTCTKASICGTAVDVWETASMPLCSVYYYDEETYTCEFGMNHCRHCRSNSRTASCR